LLSDIKKRGTDRFTKFLLHPGILLRSFLGHFEIYSDHTNIVMRIGPGYTASYRCTMRRLGLIRRVYMDI